MKNGVIDFLASAEVCDATMFKKELKLVSKKTDANH
jgi:hypothetical protein